MGTAERHDPSSLDATGLAAAIADGQITASQAMREALERVAARNPDINAVCGLREDLGLSLAARTDEELAGLTRDGRRALLAERPFLGVPTLLKDLGTAALGLPSAMGSVLYGQVEWNVDAEIVVRYRRAGLIPFGRSTSAELGLSPTSESPVYGAPTQNPWKPGHSAGGSSGGAGAALASGMVHIAHGSDGGGSIRIPASCCGVLGLKPSRGLMPLGPLKGRRLGRAGHRAHDDPVGARLRRRPGHQRRRRRGRALCRAGLARAILPRDRGGRGAGSARRRAAPHRLAQHDLRRRRDRSGSRGRGGRGRQPVRLARARTRDRRAARGLGRGPVADAAADRQRRGQCHRRLRRRARRRLAADELQPTTLGAREYARNISGAQYVSCVDACHEITRRVGRFLDRRDGQGYDLFLSPTLAGLPAAIGRYAMDNADYLAYRLGKKGVIGYSPFAPLANLTGMPAISIPFGLSRDGLPIGIQLMGPLGSEALLLALAAQVEAVKPWQRVAPMAR